MPPKTNRLNLIELVCVFVLGVMLFQPRPVTRQQAYFRFGISTICLGVFLLSGWQRSKQKRRAIADEAPLDTPLQPPVAPDPGPPPGDGRAIRVTCISTLEGSWRCHSKSFVQLRKNQIVFLALGFIPALFVKYQLRGHAPEWDFYSFPFVYVASVAFWLWLLATNLRLIHQKRFPTPDWVRRCEVALTTAGFRDVTPDQNHFFPWEQVTSIEERGGDIFVKAGNAGCFIPFESFPNRDAARWFTNAAKTLWKSRGEIWPEQAPPSRDKVPASPTSFSTWPFEENPYAAPRSPLGKNSSLFWILLGKAVPLLVTAFLIGLVVSVLTTGGFRL